MTGPSGNRNGLEETKPAQKDLSKETTNIGPQKPLEGELKIILDDYQNFIPVQINLIDPF